MFRFVRFAKNFLLALWDVVAVQKRSAFVGHGALDCENHQCLLNRHTCRTASQSWPRFIILRLVKNTACANRGVYAKNGSTQCQFPISMRTAFCHPIRETQGFFLNCLHSPRPHWRFVKIQTFAILLPAGEFYADGWNFGNFCAKLDLAAVFNGLTGVLQKTLKIAEAVRQAILTWLVFCQPRQPT